MAAPAHHERLSAIDRALLALEDGNTHMHVGAIAIYDAAPVRGPDGALDIGLLRASAEQSLHHTPRLRQRLAWVPLLGHPVWVDDDRFDLHYHLRHTALPAPGDERQLKRLVGRLMSRELDRGKPLWETWFVEGLAGDRFAMVVKAHHCMVDGVSGLGTLAAMMRPDEDRTIEPPAPWIPGPPIRLFLLGAPLREIHPVVPIFPQQALSVGLFSYDGALSWCFDADWDAVPDLHDVVLDAMDEVERLRALADAS